LLKEEGVGSIAFSPFAKGLLNDRYLYGIPSDSRVAGQSIFLNPEDIKEEKLGEGQTFKGNCCFERPKPGLDGLSLGFT
jgi:L-glyceraldehyde 3-phosphate reductase